MREHPAFRRLVSFIDDQGVTEAQIRAATWAQLRRRLWPPDGAQPDRDWLTRAGVLACLRGLFAQRNQDARRQTLLSEINGVLAPHGVRVAEVDARGERRFLLTLEKV